MDFATIFSALFLPLLSWTGAVITITLAGYPGIVCMTPLAWLLALPVGLRVHRESRSPGRGPIFESAVGGGLLGLWQGLLVPAVMLASASLPAQTLPGPPDPLFAAVLVTAISVPASAGLAALITFVARRRANP